MNKTQKLSLFVLRLALGWLMLYAGITKVINPSWSALGYLNSAKFLAGFFHWLTQPGILPVVNFLNEWGLTLLGISLILGVLVRISSLLGTLLMLLYWLPLGLPFPNQNSFIIDDHIIYILVFLLFYFLEAGKYWGLDGLRRQAS